MRDLEPADLHEMIMAEAREVLAADAALSPADRDREQAVFKRVADFVVDFAAENKIGFVKYKD